MKNHLAHYSITPVCQLLNVSRSGYLTWSKRPSKSTALAEYIKMQYWKHKARLGAPSLVYDARDRGYHVSERTISRVLHQLGLRSKAARQFKYKTDSGTNHAVVPNTLNRAFNPDKPNIVWVSDITYIKTGEKDGYIYALSSICMGVK